MISVNTFLQTKFSNEHVRQIKYQTLVRENRRNLVTLRGPLENALALEATALFTSWIVHCQSPISYIDLRNHDLDYNSLLRSEIIVKLLLTYDKQFIRK